MTIAAATILQRVKDILNDNPWSTTFSGTITSSATTLSVPDGSRWDEGRIGEFQDTGEQFWVQSVSTNTLTVIRGYNGSTAAAHDGSVTPIQIAMDPVFTIKRTKDAIELVIQQVWPQIYKTVSTSITPSNTAIWYDITTSANNPPMALVKVTQLSPSSSAGYSLYVYGTRGSGLPVNLAMNAPSTLAPTNGFALGFPRGFANTSQTVNVVYAAKLTTKNSVTSSTYDGITYFDINDGIMAEMVAYGAAAKLVMMSDIYRVTQEDIQMGDQTVQPLARTRIGRDLWSQFIFLRNMYKEELQRMNPLMSTSAGPRGRNQAASGYYGTFGYSGY